MIKKWYRHMERYLLYLHLLRLFYDIQHMFGMYVEEKFPEMGLYR